MNKYRVYINGKTFMDDATSEEIKNIFGISRLKAKNMADEQRPETVEISLEFVGEAPKQLSIPAEFAARFGKDLYNEVVQMNKRYGKRVNV